MSNAAESIETRVSSLFKGNQFLAFVYQRYSDIRLVGTPPESVGKFGGDTDNWEWPRHTGDFSVFRVYTDAAGKPAKYNAANIPLKPKWCLPVSLKPLKDGDFAMIWGYPGSTNRYEGSYGIRLATDINNPTLVSLRDVRLKYMFEEMKKDPAVKLQLASSYAGIANYWKFFDGETKQLLKYDVVGQKKKDEEKFNQWAKGKPAYENLFADWGKAYDAWRPYAKHQMVMREGILGSPLIAFASSLLQLEAALTRPGTPAAEVKKVVDAADQGRKAFLESENKVSDQKILGAVTKMYYQEIDKQQHPATFFPTLKNQYGNLEDDDTYRRYAADVFTKTIIFDDARWAAFVAKPDAATLQADPAFAYASTFITNYNSKYGIFSQQFNAKNAEFGRIYLKGVIEMDTIKAKKMYPDATFTMRVSYGNVKSYQPRDAVKYDYVTTSRGLLEKYKAGDYEFDLPTKQVELIRKKDFGQYMDPSRKDLVIGFITTNDITGGNSGIERTDFSNDVATGLVRGQTQLGTASGLFGVSSQNNGLTQPLRQINDLKGPLAVANISQQYGYVAGGDYGPDVTTVERIDYANDTSGTSVRAATLPTAHYGASFVGNVNYGYYGGGFTPGPTAKSSVFRIELPTENFNAYNSSSWWFSVGTGDIVIFPSYLTHMVEQTTSSDTRVSIAINTFLKGYVGDEHSLTGLHLNEQDDSAPYRTEP